MFQDKNLICKNLYVWGWVYKHCIDYIYIHTHTLTHIPIYIMNEQLQNEVQNTTVPSKTITYSGIKLAKYINRHLHLKLNIVEKD